jgi:hypothetical protein
MKKSYNLFAISALLLVTGFVQAQNKADNDTTLNRQIYLERNFDPTLQDAAKINTLPVIHQPEAKPVNLQYEERQPDFAFDRFPLTDTGSGSIRTTPDFDKRKGYFSFGIGNYTNIHADAGYRAVDTRSDIFDLVARHNSTNGKIDYLDPTDGFKNAKAKYSNTLLGLRYQHAFSSAVFRLNGGYEYTGFNYYGKPFINFIMASDPTHDQSVGVFSLGTALQSTANDVFGYELALDFDRFSTEYNAVSSGKDGVSGSVLNGKLHLMAPFQGNKLIGVRFGVLSQGFGNLDAVSDRELFHSLTKINAAAYWSIDGGDYDLSLGAAINYAIDRKNRFLFSPDLRFSWQLMEKAAFYADITGRINENTYLQILQENRYFNPESRVAYSRTPFDGKAGFRSGVIQGLEFDISGGYKLTLDEHLYFPTANNTYTHVSQAEYVNLQTSYVSGLLKTTLIPNTDLSAKLTGYFYTVDGDDYDGGNRIFKPWNLPSLTIDVNADVRLNEAMTLSAKYKLAAGRETIIDSGIRKMKNINELNVGGTYKPTDYFSVYLQLNNLFFQKYETWYGYTHQGFNAMAGVKLRF